MSKYQYYEFQAVDRPLTKEQMAELRALTTRATITPTRLVNEYHWGDFKGNPLVLMERYFDAFVYVANWGTHRLMLRLPARLLDPETTRLYAGDAVLTAQTKGDSVILDFSSEDEGGAGWDEDEEASNWMPALLPLRADLAGGDRRALYLAWLAGARAGLLEDDETEPPVPPGLGSLSASLRALADFLRVDEDLLAVAAAQSADLPAGPGAGRNRTVDRRAAGCGEERLAAPAGRGGPRVRPRRVPAGLPRGPGSACRCRRQRAQRGGAPCGGRGTDEGPATPGGRAGGRRAGASGARAGCRPREIP